MIFWLFFFLAPIMMFIAAIIILRQKQPILPALEFERIRAYIKYGNMPDKQRCEYCGRELDPEVDECEFCGARRS